MPSGLARPCVAPRFAFAGEPGIDPARTRAVADYVRLIRKGHSLVAHVNEGAGEAMAGFLVAQPFSRELHIWEMDVAPAFQRRGIGAGLVRAAQIDARNTGFKMADGQDLGEMNRSNQNYDDRASNCNGYVPNGNCNGNAQWTPPNGNWWEWYSSIGRGAWENNGSFDGAGGTTYAYNAVSVGFNYDAYYLGADEIGGGEYHRNYRNCNCGAFNCRTNCNCACCGNCCGWLLCVCSC